MKYLIGLLVTLFAVLLFLPSSKSEYADTGVSAYRDPFGATTREMIREDAATKRLYKSEKEDSYRTEIVADAEKQISYNERKAIETTAFYEFAASAVWAGSAPFLALILGCTVIISFCVWGLLKIGNTQAGRGTKMLPEYEDWGDRLK